MSEQFEFGFKKDFGDWIASAAIFELDRPLAFVNDDLVIGYFGRQRHRGAELSVQGQVTDDLRVIAGATYLDAKLVDNGDPDIARNEAFAVPKLSLVLYGEYDVGFIPGLTLTSNIRSEDGFFLDVENFASRKTDGFVQWDLGARYTFPTAGPNVTLRASVFNVTDDNYWVTSGFGGVLVSGGRTARLSATVEF